ncbi:hypothetical protein [Pseudactinotalea sp.]|uniref:hypothetical protein n=1 Tax=Pseudactinotalea sp. TaxID=1926260 RepID=UPI003B3A215D
MKRDIVAGALLANALPHAVVGLAGHRGLTPLGGENSSPGLNLVWAGMNLAGGVALLASASWRGLTSTAVAHRGRSVHVGIVVMAGFGLLYEQAVAARGQR